MNTDSNIPENHPRARSLQIRERMKWGVEQGLMHPTGLIAHGRGEAFDYLLGEQSPRENQLAVQAAAFAIQHAKNPVLSLNGNVVVLAAAECLQLQAAWPALQLEVNLFHRTPERIQALIAAMEEAGAPANSVLGATADGRIPGLGSDRGLCSKIGIEQADVVLVPLEDGDRAAALRNMGKTVIAIELNPLSRTASTASITLVDECTRVLGLLAQALGTPARPVPFDNEAHLVAMRTCMARGLTSRSR